VVGIPKVLPTDPRRQPPVPTWRSRRLAGLIAGTAFVIAVIIGANATILSRLHQSTLRETQTNLLRQSLTLSELVERTLQSVDLVLIGVAAKARATVTADGDVQALRRQDFFLVLRQNKWELPQIDTLGILDADGQRLNQSREWPSGELDLSSREYFQALKLDPNLPLVIAEPVRGSTTGAWVVVVARSIVGHDGRFLGVAYASMLLSYFEELFSATSLGDGYAATLARQDGTLMARYPAAGQIGARWPAPVLDKLQTARSAVTNSVSPVDNQTRIGAGYRLAKYPLVVFATENEAAAFAGWRALAVMIAVIAAVLIAVILIAAVLIARAWKQQERLNAATAEVIESDKIRSLAQAELNRRHDLSEQNVRFASAMEHMAHGLCMYDRDTRLVICNSRYAELYDLTPDQIRPGTTLRSILEARAAAGKTPADIKGYIERRLAEVRAQDPYYVENELRDGRTIAVTHQPMQDGGWVAIHQDVTQRRRNEAQIAFMATHDALTGLANRILFRQRIAEAGARHRRDGERFSVLMLDLDHFKVVNDSVGHSGGDVLLQEMAQRLRAVLAETDVLARLGGDEFAILCGGGTAQRDDATALAARIVDTVARPFDLDGSKLGVGVSIGIALAPQDGVDPDELLRKADLALYRTKARGRNGASFFDPAMMAEADARHRLAGELRDALTREEFELHYQPVIDLATRAPCGAEALVRWRHPQHGLIAPDRFIPLAEETGLIVELGTWILRRACADAAAWPAHFRLAVNLSPVQFRRGDLYDVVVNALADSGLTAERLEIEITESVLLDRDANCQVLLQQLRDIGIAIAVDDFGTGFSSLAYITSFPVDKIKIDKSFIQGVAERAECAAVIASVITLARGLDIATTAEGVETEQQLELLRVAGVTSAQGYLFGRPVPHAELGFDRPGADARAAAVA
jgi:diguanylate cyclase (GGDEF)-like protein